MSRFDLWAVVYQSLNYLSIISFSVNVFSSYILFNKSLPTPRSWEHLWYLDVSRYLETLLFSCSHLDQQPNWISFLCNTKIGVQLLFLFFIQIANRSKNIYLKDCSEHHICPRLNIHKCVSLFLGSQFCSIGLFACAWDKKPHSLNYIDFSEGKKKVSILFSSRWF